jgi:hypothetical protein
VVWAVVVALVVEVAVVVDEVNVVVVVEEVDVVVVVTAVVVVISSLSQILLSFVSRQQSVPTMIYGLLHTGLVIQPAKTASNKTAEIRRIRIPTTLY